MKKNIAIILAALFLCTACSSSPVESAAGSPEPADSASSSTTTSAVGSDGTEQAVQSAETPKTEEASAPQTTAPETPVTAESASDAFFTPGIWQCTEYVFYQFGEHGGSMIDYDTGVGQPFEYEVTDPDSGAIMFHIFSADDQSPATAKVISDTEIEMTWDYGLTINLTYLPGKTMEDLDAQFRNYIKPGTWNCDNESYYFFNEDGESGSTLSFEKGIGVGFRYSVTSRSEGFVNFSMGAADNSQGVVITDLAEDSFTLIWESGQSQNFTYVSPQSADEFKFYTDDQLHDIVLKYYQEDNNNYKPQYSGVQHNSDGTATVHLLDISGDQSYTAALCTLDRVTLKGTNDLTGAEIDLSGYAE